MQASQLRFKMRSRCAQALAAVTRSPQDYHVVAAAAAVAQAAKAQSPGFNLRTDALEARVLVPAASTPEPSTS